MPYQTFPGQPGDSDSEAKWRGMFLDPERVAGASVLDLGCNEGFFLGKMRACGAAVVMGVDRDREAIKAAQERLPEGGFCCVDWTKFLRRFPEPFDYILWLSSMHYADDPAEMLALIRSHLRPGGKLILECGVVVGEYDLGRQWVLSRRGEALVRHPTALLLADLLAGYAVRRVGRSVPQDGDPVQRFCYHCTPREPIAYLVSGPGEAGKTVAAGTFGCSVFRLDSQIALLEQFATPDWWQPIDHAGEGYQPLFRLIETAHAAEFADWVARCLPPGDVAIEGYGLYLPQTGAAIREALRTRGYRLWDVQRG